MMATLRAVPPGRGGRIWLQRRLALARNAASRLDLKLRILRTDQVRAALLVERTRPEWEEQCRAAGTWLLRAALLGGEAAVRPSGNVPPAEVSVVWTSSMGTSYPAEAVLVIPEPDPHTTPLSSAGVIEARSAYCRALDAAVQHAVAEWASRAIDAEVLSTRQRLRGVQDRWVPRLDGALTRLRLALDEAEQADGVRLRWAARQRERRSP